MPIQNRYKPLLGGVAVLAAAASVVSFTIQPAAADPTRPYAATGSDTTQDVWNGLTNDFGAPIPSVASWNAFAVGDPGSFIQTKTNGNWFVRPAGSGNGVRSLSAVWDPAFPSHLWPAGTGVVLNHEDVDFARSSGGPTAGTGLKYIPFARDAVTIAYNSNSTTLGSSLNLTTGQITELYSGVDDAADSVVTFSPGPVTASTIVSINGQAVQPKVPQRGSGTRTFFLGAAGFGTASTPNPPLAPYIADPATGGFPENSGAALPNPGDLIPFSAAQWIGQNNGKVPDTTAPGLVLASIGGKAPTSGTAPTLAPGDLYGPLNPAGTDYNTIPGTGVGVYNRDTYDVVPTSFITGTAKQQALVSTLGSTLGVYGATAKGIVKAFGFGTLSYGSQSGNWRDGLWLH